MRNATEDLLNTPTKNAAAASVNRGFGLAMVMRFAVTRGGECIWIPCLFE